MEEEIVYGILMQKKQLDENNYIFMPVHLISGIILGEDVFADELGNSYYIFNTKVNDGDCFELEDEYYIGINITEKQLMEQYPDDILENAKMKFYKLVKKYCIVLKEDKEGYDFVFMDIDHFFDKLCDEYVDDFFDKLSDEHEENCDSKNTINPEINTETNNNEEDKPQRLWALSGDDVSNFIKLMNNKEYDKLIKLFSSFQDHWFTNFEPEKIETQQITAPKTKKELKPSTEIIDVKDFYTRARKKVIGQDEAIKDIISAVKMDQYANNSAERNRCFIIGPTGTGKTEIVKCLGEYLDKPVLKVDTTQITVPGYVGSSLEEYLSRLVSLAGGDIKKAENGIITFDEIDKKCGSDDKLFGQGFLYTLLPFLDGTDYTITVNGAKRNFNTSNLTVFASGSFSEIIKNTNLTKNAIGFNSKGLNTNVDVKTFDSDEIFKKASMPEELIGRFPIVVQLNPHTEESLVKILLESDISQLKAEKRKFKCLGIDLNWEDKYIEAVAKKAIKLNIGARSLKKIVDSSVKELRWEILTNPNKYKSVTLLEQTVNNPKVYKLK